jgi:tetratricopeptide (TPR) repeat protein
MQNLEALLDQAIEFCDNGDKDEAIRIYEQILSEKEDWATAHYNLGLIYKYRNDWHKSYHHNKRAVELDPKMDAAQWNLGIAATMLKDWKLARQCWNFFGMNYEIIDYDTAGKLADVCIRISPNAEAETVWATRICPARAIIKNIPLPESEHRFKDMVLNDGAPNGYRMSEGQEYPVLDEIQHLSSSDYQTYSIKCKLISEAQFEDLQQRCWKSDIAIENWTTSVQMLCKQCSEGKPHEHHDHDLKKASAEFRIALATTSQEKLITVLETWRHEIGIDYYEFLYY